jgi:uncharacterized protein (TIGR03083 family)
VTELRPVGERVRGGQARAPMRRPIEGTFVRLEPVDPERHVGALFDATHGTQDGDAVWTYLGYGPFADREAMDRWFASLVPSSDPLFFTVVDRATDVPQGVLSYLNIDRPMRHVEIGHIWYVPAAQRTRANTEATYLLLREAFDVLGNRRVEWKCDALNARSRAAADRLGFSFEGIFRRHMVVKGRNRDTAWFAMLDDEWPDVRSNINAWLQADPGSVSLRALTTASRYERDVRALAQESEQVEAVLRSLDDADLTKPTRCDAWDVHGLIGHLIRDVDRILAYLPEPAPSEPDKDAVSYYRAYDPVAVAPQVARSAVETADRFGTLAELAQGFATTWRAAVEGARAAGPDRVLATRRGGPALRMDDYVPTRVLEMTVHGLDLADALGRAPWTTADAAAITRRILQGLLGAEPPLDWDDPTFFDKGTGRAPLSRQDRAALRGSAGRFPLLA